MTGHRRDDAKPVRIISASNTRGWEGSGKLLSEAFDKPTLGAFIRECYDWWRDGCNCIACSCIDSWETGRCSDYTFSHRMMLCSDVANGRHGDGVTLPRQQLQLFASWRRRD